MKDLNLITIGLLFRGISQNDQFNEIKDLNWIMIGKDGNLKY